MKSSPEKSPPEAKYDTLIPGDELPNEAYHGLVGVFSSSQLKDVLKDEDIFLAKYIHKTLENSSDSDALGVGTYFHTMLLEPQKVDKEIAIFPGKVRHGKAWDEFKNSNPGKTIVTTSGKETGDKLVEAVKNSKTALEYLVGRPEISLITEVEVLGDVVFSRKYAKKLGKDGWEDISTKSFPRGITVALKVRADVLGDKFISDLKSTSSPANSKLAISTAISTYSYDLSSALYLDLFGLVVPNLREFVWIFASKLDGLSTSWSAGQDILRIGRAKWCDAVKKIATLKKNNWASAMSQDQLHVAEPLDWENHAWSNYFTKHGQLEDML